MLSPSETQGATKTVAEHLVDYLERRDVRHVFGLCGHTNIAVLAVQPVNLHPVNKPVTRPTANICQHQLPCV